MSGAHDRVTAALRVLARLNRVLESADSGLTVPQYRMLTALHEGGERSARLAERLAIRKPTVTALADGLIAAGYAERQSEAGDRRIVRLHITEAGRVAVAGAERAYAARLVPLLAEVADEDQFVDALLAIGAALDDRLATQRRDATTERTDAAHRDATTERTDAAHGDGTTEGTDGTTAHRDGTADGTGAAAGRDGGARPTGATAARTGSGATAGGKR